MKKSILKSVVSVFAATAMLITSANLVFAENDYMSYTNDFSSSTGVTINNKINVDKDHIKMEVVDGVLKSNRTHYDKQDGDSDRAAGAKASIAFGKSFSTGKVQVKFDFTMNDKRSFLVEFDGYQKKSDSGLLITQNDVRLIYPTGGFQPPTAFAKPIAVDGTVYTLTVTLDIASGVFTGDIVKKNDTTDVKPFNLKISAWGDETHGAVTGLSIESLRAQDLGNGVMTFDNLSVDAYTEYNYEVGGIYRSADGVETNKKSEGYTFKGYTLSALTNFVNPNASFITASYDTSGRMLEADVTPASEVGSDVVVPKVEGDTVKAFVFNMTNAAPLASLYVPEADPETTVRKWDFGDDYTPSATASGATATKVNGALKIERTVFRPSVNGSSVNYYWNGSNWTTTSMPGNLKNAFSLDEKVTSFTLSFKVKFDKNENVKGQQAVDITFAGDSPIILQRNQDGSVELAHFYDSKGNVSLDCNLDADVWYDITLKETLTDSNSTSEWTISKDGNVVGYKSVTVGKGLTGLGITGVSAINIGSRRDKDLISASWSADDKTHSSVWYIDDVVVEY